MSRQATIWHHHSRILSALALVALVCLAIAVRWWTIRDRLVFFHFDQARDAFVARQMITHHDWKIQGPSASGTNETVYHGVLYYYVIAPLYALFAGDPYPVTQALALIGALTLVPLFWLSQDILKSKWWALWVCLLAAFSLESAHSSTWLSNPTLVLVGSAWFYLSLWQLFFRQKSGWWPGLALSLGWCHQAVVVTIFLWASLALAWIWQKKSGKPLPITKLQLLGMGCLYVGMIATMILVQARLAWQGIFTPQALAQAAGSHPEYAVNQLLLVAEMYSRKFALSLLPSWPVTSFLGIGWLAWTSRRWSNPHQWFIGIWLGAPLALFALHTRAAYHALMGLELPLYLGLALSLQPQLAKLSQLNRTLILGTLTGLILASQLSAIAAYRRQEMTIYSTEKGFSLQQEQRAVNAMYQSAAGQPFSVTTLTTPYRYSMTWAYLWSWYGQNTYHYLPTWVGNSQTGTVWAAALPEQSQRLPHHSALLEKSSGIESWMKTSFLAEQPPLSSVRSQLDSTGFDVLNF